MKVTEGMSRTEYKAFMERMYETDFRKCLLGPRKELALYRKCLEVVSRDEIMEVAEMLGYGYWTCGNRGRRVVRSTGRRAVNRVRTMIICRMGESEVN